MKEISGAFIDAVSWDEKTKSVISVRDGVLEYSGAELGIEPSDKTFTVYRSPATIANVAGSMGSIPVTDQHVEVGSDISDSVGTVIDAKMIDMDDENTSSKLAIKNSVKMSDGFLESIENRELSLGYNARLVPHDKFDFEQRDIEPHHLAVVDTGRCGPACRFVDHTKKEIEAVAKSKKEETKLNGVFLDAEGVPNLEQIVEIATALPDALKKLPGEELAKVMPMLQEIVAKAKETVAPSTEQKPTNTDMEAPAGEKPKPEVMPVTDSAEFKDGVKLALAKHTAVVVRAADFVSDDYDFTDKTTDEIMRDVVETIHGKDRFSDEELPVAFKMLKAQASDLSNFGDAANGGRFSSVADKEI